MVKRLAVVLGDGLALPAGAHDISVQGLTADSRLVQPGFVFFALKGTAADGTSYVKDAIERGAVAVVAATGVALSCKVPVISDAQPRQRLAIAAANYYGRQPDLAVAVTGTNGKTSVASFVREIWTEMGFAAASIGTVGVVSPAGEYYLGSTTPDPVALHEALAGLVAAGVSHLAIEASSHGLAQHRLDGMRLSAGAFTNLTRDHLDYHATFEDYRDAKARLFSEVLHPGAAAVINADGAFADHMSAVAQARGLTLFTVGAQGAQLRLVNASPVGLGQQLTISGVAERSVYLPLVGAFQASNALVAAGLVIATGGEPSLVLHALESLKGAKGRLELVGRLGRGASIFVDYAHTPDALANALMALRPSVTGRLCVVFGCGGDRDPGKRPQMGAVAARLADVIYVTDDNPRSEDPAQIRAAVLAACPGGIDAGDRHEAIIRAIEGLKSGDVLLIAGKGHETGQIIGKETRLFSDHDEVMKAVNSLGGA